MATSSIPTVKANLVTQLSARGGLTGVQVTNGPPLPTPQRELIWVGTAQGRQELGSFGTSGLRHEEYGLEVIVNVKREGTDTATADARCFTIAGELEAQLRSDPQINGALPSGVASFGEFRLDEYVGRDDMSRESRLTVTVDVDNWI